MCNLVGQVLQIIGIAIILSGQVVFYLRIRKKYGSLKKAFLDFVAPRQSPSDEELSKMSQTQINELFEKFPLAKFLREDFIISVLGLFCSLIGTLL